MRPDHGVRSPAPRLVLARPGFGSSGVFAELLAGRPGCKTRSAAGFFFFLGFGFFFGGGGRGSSPGRGSFVGSRIATTARRHEEFGARTRTFTLTSKDDGSTDFSMNEMLAGVMLPMIKGSLPDFAPAFEAYAGDLKREAERTT